MNRATIRECPECKEPILTSAAVRLKSGIICPECSAVIPDDAGERVTIEDSTARGFDPTAYFDP